MDMSDGLVSGDVENPWPSVVICGALGAGLVVAGRKVRPGLLSWVANTVGYTLLTRAITKGVYSSLSN